MYCKFFTFCLCFILNAFKKFSNTSTGEPGKEEADACYHQVVSRTQLCYRSLPSAVAGATSCTSHFQSRTMQRTAGSLPCPPKLATTIKRWWRDAQAENPGASRNTPTPLARKALLPPERLSTCCPGGWRRRGARSAARSWAAGSGRTSGRRSAPRRPSPPLPSSAAHVLAPAREQRRGPAWTSTGTPSPAGRQGPSSSRGLSPGCQGSRPRPRGSPISIDCKTRPGALDGGGGPWGRGAGVGSLPLGNWKPAVILQGSGELLYSSFFLALFLFLFLFSPPPFHREAYPIARNISCLVAWSERKKPCPGARAEQESSQVHACGLGRKEENATLI